MNVAGPLQGGCRCEREGNNRVVGFPFYRIVTRRTDSVLCGRHDGGKRRIGYTEKDPRPPWPRLGPSGWRRRYAV